MQKSALFLALLCGFGLAAFWHVPVHETGLNTAVYNSVPYVGADRPAATGHDGRGIIIGIIDTGVDHTHPDLYGTGPDGKVIMAHNFFDGEPLDINGHGTEVAGIIAADGALQGMAPKARIISYKVSDDGESVSSDLIIAAVSQAIKDGVDIINISLGVNRTNERIDHAVNMAVESGITVIVAAGNDGPEPGTIGSPGLNHRAITVGATYNNHTSSLAATLEINDRQFQVLPMMDGPSTKIPAKAGIVFGGYAREADFEGGGFEGAIVIAERGSDVKDETVYFSDKEKNAADAGAVALIVYNNEQGTYLGELIHEHVGDGYHPRIPTVSISRQDGLEIRDYVAATGEIHIFYSPDFVAHFSSRGPVSPFYTKPDLVAPGVYVNTTLNDGRYNVTSGTSFAAPHVAGAAALLLQKNPGLSPDDIKSILVTTADPITDAYGAGYYPESAGAGRLNVTRAFDADIIASPPFLTMELSADGRTDEQVVRTRSLGGARIDGVTLEAPDQVRLSHSIQGGTITVHAELAGNETGKFHGRMNITGGDAHYGIPILIHSTEGSIAAREDGGVIAVGVSQPEDWTYAKIYVTNSETGERISSSVRPDGGGITVSRNGTYWIEAKIDAGGRTIDAYDRITVDSAAKEQGLELGIPHRQAAVIAVFVSAAALAGFGLRIKAGVPRSESPAGRF